jgi:hypothetical protein
VRYLTLSETLEIHIRIIAQTGGALGILNLGTLEAALAQPQMTFKWDRSLSNRRREGRGVRIFTYTKSSICGRG